MKQTLRFILSLATFWAMTAAQSQDFSGYSGGVLPDNNGVHVNAHGGGILYQKGIYYWFGEHKGEGEVGNRSFDGVHCYSSKNLKDWKDEGIALTMSKDPKSLLIEGCILERPKVIYNEKTGKYVMWFHHELKDKGYSAALTGLAVSDKATGPYKYIHSIRPNAGVWPVGFPNKLKKKAIAEPAKKRSPEWVKWVEQGGFLRRDFEGGQMSRDMTLFIDVDGTAYHIASAEENQTIHISALSEDYLSFTGKYKRVLPAGRNEGPAIFLKNGKYYMISSGLTGWKPNPARAAVADKLMGDWTPLGNPCIGTAEEISTTFQSQSTFVIDVEGKEEQYIFMADRWRPENAIDGGYVWVEIEFDQKDKPILKWENIWQ
ncbi:MAG: glycoside hydrolase family 43 protein [Cyclobacteriaceae bacterium]